MKALFSLSLAALALSATVVHAQRFQQEAVLIYHQDKVERVWIGDANKAQILYYETEKGVDSKKLAISKPQSIWLMEPPAYTAALEDFQGRRYEQALEGFRAVREEYKNLIELPDNHSSLAAFYAMECLRKLERFDELAKAREEFQPDDRESLTRSYQQTQLELYPMWEALNAKSWDRLEGIARTHLDKKLPGNQRAQVGYALGVALEGQKRPFEALDSYNLAITADAGGSEVVAANAAERAMRLYLEDENVKAAKRLHGTPEEAPGSTGAARLREAGALSKLYQATLGGGRTLPPELAELSKYAAKAE